MDWGDGTDRKGVRRDLSGVDERGDRLKKANAVGVFVRRQCWFSEGLVVTLNLLSVINGVGRAEIRESTRHMHCHANGSQISHLSL